MTTKKNGAKSIAKQISCDFKCKFNSNTCNSNQKQNNEICQCEYKIYYTCKVIKEGILARVFVSMISI